MTELSEVKDWQNDLQDILEDLKYEAATQPGEKPKVKAIFLSVAQRLQEDIEVLEKATEIMKTYVD